MASKENEMVMVHCTNCDKNSSVIVNYKKQEISFLWVVFWLIMFFPVAVGMILGHFMFTDNVNKKRIKKEIPKNACKHCGEHALMYVNG